MWIGVKILFFTKNERKDCVLTEKVILYMAACHWHENSETEKIFLDGFALFIISKLIKNQI